MNQVKQNQSMTVYGDGTQRRAFSHIQDVAPTLARSIEVTAAYNQIFNIGGDSTYTINHLVDVIARIMTVEKKVEYLPARHESYHAYSSHEKLTRVFGKHESISLEEGIEKMAEWVLNSEYTPSPVISDIEIRKNMPPSWEALSGQHDR
jgi:UDP-glucose 4-epimerase